MKGKKRMLQMLTAGVLSAALLAGSALAAGPEIRVGSYKGHTLEPGERSMVTVSPYGTTVTAVSSNPGVITLEQVCGYTVMAAKAPGTATVSVTDEAGNTASMTITVSGGETASAPPQAASSTDPEGPAAVSPVVNNEWSHKPVYRSCVLPPFLRLSRPAAPALIRSVSAWTSFTAWSHAFFRAVTGNVVLFIPGVMLMDALWNLPGVIATQPVVESIVMAVSIILYFLNQKRENVS